MRLIVNGLIFFSFFSLTFCTDQKEKRNATMASKSIDSTFHYVNSFGHVRGDTSAFTKLKCGLFVNSEGILAYQAVDNSYRMMDTPANGKAYYVYLTTVWGADDTDSINGSGKEMRYVADTTTFQLLGLYGIDKNHVYDINPMLDGGTIGINKDTVIIADALLKAQTLQVSKC
jgi:hypothetical protein